MQQVLSNIGEAKHLIDQYESERRSGRTPQEINEARLLMQMFTEAARDVIPIKTLIQSHHDLGRFIALLNQGKSQKI